MNGNLSEQGLLCNLCNLGPKAAISHRYQCLLVNLFSVLFTSGSLVQARLFPLRQTSCLAEALLVEISDFLLLSP